MRRPCRRTPTWVAVAIAFLALLQASPASAGEDPGGMNGWSPFTGVAGFLRYQALDLASLNEKLGASVPALPAGGYQVGYGVVSIFPSGWGFSTAGGELELSATRGEGVSRLRLYHTQLGIDRRLAGTRSWDLLAETRLGLAAADLEVTSGKPDSYSDFRMNRWTRYVVTLEPGLRLIRWFGDGALGLQIAAAYQMGSDFWNPRWAHLSGGDLPGDPAWLRGPVLEVSLVVAGRGED